MQIVVNTDKLRSTASKLEGIISDLSEKRNNLIRLQSNLDYSIRYARNINQTIVNLSSRLYEAQCDLNRIKTFLNTTANKYDTAEETINRAFNRMCELTGGSVNGSNSNSTGAIQASGESTTKWYEKEWVKWVGGIALGAGAVAAAVFLPGTYIAAVGIATVAGGLMNGALGCIEAAVTGEDKSEAFINNFISGAVGSGLGSAAFFISPVFGGVVGNGVTTVVDNLLEGKKWNDNLGESLIIGGIAGKLAEPLEDLAVKGISWISNKVNSTVANATGSFITNSLDNMPSFIKGTASFNSDIYIPNETLTDALATPITNQIGDMVEEAFNNYVAEPLEDLAVKGISWISNKVNSTVANATGSSLDNMPSFIKGTASLDSDIYIYA